MQKRLILGIILLVLGLALSTQGRRPYIDVDFHLTWFGFLLISDSVSFYLSGKSIFSNWRNFLTLAFASSFFWWFYEWTNISLQNWGYPLKPLYDSVEWGIFTTLAFTTVLPHLIISTNIIQGILRKYNFTFGNGTISLSFAYLLIVLGIVCLTLSIYIPLYSFPLIWFVVFLILDPINAISGRRSLILQLLKRNYLLIGILVLSAIYAGFWWETINIFVPKWIYPIVPWFWDLPAPITTKYAQMPLAGFLGYIPFIFSAFAFVEFLQIGTNWLRKD